MNLNELKSQVALGEDSRRQFKRDMTNADALAAEMAAFPTPKAGGRDSLTKQQNYCNIR